MEVLLDPFQKRIYALGALAGKARQEVAAAAPKRGRRGAVTTESWEVTYAKICWRCVQAEFGDDEACGLHADSEGNFVHFIRAMAEFASGERVESGFGGVVKKAIAWGKRMANGESQSRKFLETGERPAPAFHMIEDAVRIGYRGIERCEPAGAMNLTAGLLAQQLAASHPGLPATN